jgi:hypothetical protein
MSSTDDVQYIESDNDEAAHEASYRQFSLLVYIAVFHVANFLVALAIGAIQGNWIEAFIVMFLAIILAVFGLMKAILLGLNG